MWSAGKDGLVSGTLTTSKGTTADANFDDLAAGKSESFVFKLNDKNYALKATGNIISQDTNKPLYTTLNALAGATKPNGSLVYYNGKAYISAQGIWREITNTGINYDIITNSGTYKSFMDTLKGTK